MRTRWTRKFYLSGWNAEKQPLPKDIPAGAELYYFDANGKPGMMAFSGKRQKPDKYYTYPSEDARKRAAENWVNGLMAHVEYMEQRRQERKEFRHTLKVGDILYGTWGYDQTNVNFYQVIATTAKTATVREIAQTKNQDHGWLCGTTMPVKDHFVSDPFKNRKVGKGNYINIDRVRHGSPWDGKPVTWSGYA